MTGRIVLNRPDISHRPPNFTPECSEFGDTWDTVLSSLNTMLTEVFSGASTIAGAKTYSGAQQFNSSVAVQAGTSGSSYTPAGNLSRSLTTIGSSATNTTQTLATYSMPANTLASTNQGLLITAWGRKAANAAGVTFALNFGGASINSGNGTQNGVSWAFTGEVYKTTANAQNLLFTGQVGAVASAVKSTTDTSVDTNTITITLQALDGSAAQSNVLLDGLTVEYFG